MNKPSETSTVVELIVVVDPDIVKSPSRVKFLIPPISLLASTTKALLADAVPFVILSIFPKSVPSISTEPILKLVPAVTDVVAVIVVPELI